MFYIVLSIIPIKIPSQKLWKVAHLPPFQWISPDGGKNTDFQITQKIISERLSIQNFILNNFTIRDRFHISNSLRDIRV